MRRTQVAAVALGLVCWSSTMAGGQAPAAARQPIPNMAGRIMTVNGPINPDQLGSTITHEHIFIDFNVPEDSPERWALSANRTRPVGATAVELYNAPLTMRNLAAVSLGAANRDNWTLLNEKQAIDEVMEFKRHGGGTIVDVTSIGLKRDPEALSRVSTATGLHVVMGASWYVKTWHPTDMDARTVESLTDEIVRDVTVGVGNSGIRSGVIGEVGTEGNPLTPNEIKVIRASGRASRLTGAAVSLHTLVNRNEQLRILDLLAAEGTDLKRVIVGHHNSIVADLSLAKQLLDRGVYVQFDLLGRTPTPRSRVTDGDVAKGIVELIKMGFGDRILLSQDICTKIQLKAYGGTGFSFIQEQFIPYLRTLGVTDAQINTMMVENPQRALTFVAPQQPVRATN